MDNENIVKNESGNIVERHYNFKNRGKYILATRNYGHRVEDTQENTPLVKFINVK